MIVRKIMLEDAEQFSQLLLRIDASNTMMFEPGERKTSTEIEEKYIESIYFQRNSTIFVAEHNERLIGYITAIGGQLARKQHSAVVVCGIVEEYREQGICLQLFDSLVAWAHEADVIRLEAAIPESNQHALQLYKKVGFQTEGEKIDSLLINGELINEILLYKRID